jgi:hypothetical protein
VNTQAGSSTGKYGGCRPFSAQGDAGTNGVWDLVSSVTDDNKILKNPEWSFQKFNETPMNLQFCLRNGVFECSTQNVTIDLPTGVDGLACNVPDNPVGIDGHVNWFDATYEGTVTWNENSTDHDFNLDMGSFSPMGPLHMEFKSDESIDHFATPWWKMFHDNVTGEFGPTDPPKYSPPCQYPDDKKKCQGFTIVTGLFGLDCEHDCHVEIHPIHAIAMRINDDPSDETWAIFVRNWGTEGFCSSQNHAIDLENGVFTFRLPWNTVPLGRVSVGNATTFQGKVSNVIGPIVVPEPPRPPLRHDAGGLLVSFVLPAPDVGEIINGELHLVWSGPVSTSSPGEPASPQPPVAEHRAASPLPAKEEAGKPSVEDRLGAVVQRMSPAQRQIYKQKLQQTVSFHTMPLRPGTPADIRPATQPPGVRHLPDPSKAAADQALHDALCAAYANNITEFPGWCAAPVQPIPMQPAAPPAVRP